MHGQGRRVHGQTSWNICDWNGNGGKYIEGNKYIVHSRYSIVSLSLSLVPFVVYH